MFIEGTSFFTIAAHTVLAASVGLSACAPRIDESRVSLDEYSCRERWAPARLFLHEERILNDYGELEAVVFIAENATTGRPELVVVHPGGEEYMPVPTFEPNWVTWMTRSPGFQETARWLWVYQEEGGNEYTNAPALSGIFCYNLVVDKHDPLPNRLEDWQYMDNPATAWAPLPSLTSAYQ